MSGGILFKDLHEMTLSVYSFIGFKLKIANCFLGGEMLQVRLRKKRGFQDKKNIALDHYKE